MGREKQIAIAIYFAALFTLLFASFVIAPKFGIKLKGDWWFELTAKKIVAEGTTQIDWGFSNNPDMQTDYEIQKGIYENWRPFGYSLFLTIPILIDGSEESFVIAQSVVYAFIPVVAYLIAFFFSTVKRGVLR